MATTPWTVGAARLIQAGGIDTSNGKKEVKDIYALILNSGTRPEPGSNGIPDYGADHPSVDGLSVTNVSFSQPDHTSKVWNAIVTYSAGASNPGDNTDTSKYTRLHIGTVTELRDLVEDAEATQQNPKPVLNAAGDPFESVPQVERHLVEIQITRNQNSSPASDIASLNNTLNSAQLTVCEIVIGAKCGRISIEADRQFGAGAAKWSVTFRIVVNPDGWTYKVLQNGYRYKPGGVGDAVKFTSTTEDGRVVECSTPQLLKTDGDDGRGGPAYYAEFNAYKSADWSELKLPSLL